MPFILSNPHTCVHCAISHEVLPSSSEFTQQAIYAYEYAEVFVSNFARLQIHLKIAFLVKILGAVDKSMPWTV